MDNEYEVNELLEMLYNTITDAWGVPLGKDKCMIQREPTLNLLDEIRAQLPVEITEAKRLISARDEYIANAKREAESVRRTAEEESRRLVDEQEIVQTARARANEIISAAENRSRELMRAANEYVDDAMRRTEEAVNAALAEIRQSRTRFRSASGLKQSAGEMQTLTPDEFEEN